MTAKRSFGCTLHIIFLCIGIAIVYTRWLSSPQYMIASLSEAIRNHDTVAFCKLVDVDSLSKELADALLDERSLDSSADANDSSEQSMLQAAAGNELPCEQQLATDKKLVVALIRTNLLNYVHEGRWDHNTNKIAAMYVLSHRTGQSRMQLLGKLANGLHLGKQIQRLLFEDLADAKSHVKIAGQAEPRLTLRLQKQASGCQFMGIGLPDHWRLVAVENLDEIAMLPN